MEQGDYEATLVELHRLDAYRAQRAKTKLSSSGYYHSIGFNAGFVGLATEASLIADVNAAIGALLAGDQLPLLAQAAGLTYVPPRQPDVVAAMSPQELRGE
jgi:hypothetical protein